MKRPLQRRLVEAWGTVITIDCADADPAALDAALPEIHTLVAHIDEVFSTWRPDSVISMRRRGEPTSPPSLISSAPTVNRRARSPAALSIRGAPREAWTSPGTSKAGAPA